MLSVKSIYRLSSVFQHILLTVELEEEEVNRLSLADVMVAGGTCSRQFLGVTDRLHLSTSDITNH